MKYVILILLGFLVGCDPPVPAKKFTTREITIVCVDKARMAVVLAERVPYDPFAPYCNSYYDAYKGIIYVSWSKDKDINGQPMPDFKDLGHEVWHVAAGWWHGGSVFVPSRTNAPVDVIKVTKAIVTKVRDIF